MKSKLLIGIFISIFLISLVSANNISLFTNNVAYAGSNVIYQFNFSSANNCLPVNSILSYTRWIQFDARGIGFVSLDISNLTQMPVKLCEFRENVLRQNHSFNNIIFNTIFAKNLNLSNNAIIKGRVNVTGNITASWFRGKLNASYIQNSPWYTKTQIKNFKYYNSTNFSIINYYNKTQINNLGYYNSSDFSISSYYLKSNPFGFYNSSTLVEHDPKWSANISSYYTKLLDPWSANRTSYYTKTQVDNNLTTRYYLRTNPFGFYNSSNAYTKAQVDNNLTTRYYLRTNPFGFYNSSNAYTKTQVDTNLTTRYVPYIGASSNVNLGARNLTINTNTLFVSTGGRVGIGTTEPGANLHSAKDIVWTSATSVPGQIFLGGATDTVKRLVLGFDTTSNFGFIQATQPGFDFRNLVLQGGGGNVGIGTTSPKNKLNVIGIANITGVLYYKGSLNPYSFFNSSTLVEHDPKWSANISSYYTKLLDPWSANRTSYYTKTQVDNNLTTRYYLRTNPFGFYNSSNAYTKTQVDNNLTTRYYLRTNPFGFYNSSNAYTKTQVDNNLTTRYVPYTGASSNVNLGARNLTINTNTLFVSTGGKIGIGTVTPSGILSVTPTQYSTGTASQSLTTVTGVGTNFTSAMVGSQLVYANGVSGGTITVFTSITSLTVSTSQTIASQAYNIAYTGLQVGSTGNIGIGTSTPKNLLNVKGDANITGVLYYKGSLNPYSFFNSSTLVEHDPKWSANISSYYTKLLDPWSANRTLYYTKTQVDNNLTTRYYLKSNPFGFWNSTKATFNKTYADTLYSTKAEPLWSGNRTLLYLKSNPFGFYNSSNAYTKAQVDNNLTTRYYLRTNPFGFYNSSNAYTKTQVDTNLTTRYVPYIGASSNVNLGARNLTINTNTLFVSTGGRVGIGTTGPQAITHIRQDVANGAGAFLYLQNSQYANAEGATTGIRFNIYGENIRYGDIKAVGKSIYGMVDRIAIGIMNDTDTYVEALSIKNSGNVGIGTTAPKSLLHVAQNDGAGDAVRAPIIMSRYWFNDSDTRAAAIFNYYNSANTNDQLVFGVTGGGGQTTSPALYSNAKMVIQANGNVGIGTTGPQDKLDIEGGSIVVNRYTGHAASGLYLSSTIAPAHYNWRITAQDQVDTALEFGPSTAAGVTTWATPTVVFKQAGNVGIGTTSPKNKLNVIGSVNATTGFIVGAFTGITNTTGYWLCKNSACSTTCQVQINGGIITGCI